MIPKLLTALCRLFTGVRTGHRWSKHTLVVGPSQPVDGDSVACTKAMINFLRKRGLEAYTLPTLTMYKQLAWILQSDDYHKAALSAAHQDFTVDNLQEAFDTLIATWRPDEILLLDGPLTRLGFDPRGITVFNVDHHIVDEEHDDRDAFVHVAPSVGCLLIEKYRVFDPILAVSILTDTFWLRQNMPAQAAHYLGILSEHGLTDDVLADMQRKLMVRKDAQIVVAMNEADMRIEGEIAFLVLKDERPEIHRGVMAELGYFCHHICVVRPDGYVSFKTENSDIDLRPLATKYGGGGHKTVAAGQLPSGFTTDLLEELHADFVAAVSV
jgi:nanoRNase/pAp phosphatase (c-di-AMP/oligoRNAs hydrolase)